MKYYLLYNDDGTLCGYHATENTSTAWGAKEVSKEEFIQNGGTLREETAPPKEVNSIEALVDAIIQQ